MPPISHLIWADPSSKETDDLPRVAHGNTIRSAMGRAEERYGLSRRIERWIR